MTFRVGQKVVCVEGPIWTKACVTQPKTGEVYTVRDIVRGYDGNKFRPGVVLVEITNPIGPFGTEYNFRPSRFRPVVERKTDISVFTEILRKATKPARTPAMSQQELS